MKLLVTWKSSATLRKNNTEKFTTYCPAGRASMGEAFLLQTLPSTCNPCQDLYFLSVRPSQQSAEAPGVSLSYVLSSYTPEGFLRRRLLDMLGRQGFFSTYSGVFWARGSLQFKLSLWGPFFSLSYASELCFLKVGTCITRGTGSQCPPSPHLSTGCKTAANPLH